MGKRKKTAFWVMGVLGGLLVLLLIFLLLLPRLINLKPIREKIITTISQEVGGEVGFQTIDLSFLPRPRVMIHEVSLSIPGEITGTLKSLKVYPEIFPLLRGRIQLTMLRMESPDLNMKFPARVGEKETRIEGFFFETIEKSMVGAFGLMASKAPGLVFFVDNGRLTLASENKPVFWFGDIHGRISLPPDRFEIDVACDSNLWERASVKGSLGSKDFRGEGRIELANFQLQGLTDYFAPNARPRVGDSLVSLTISFKADGFKAVQGEVQGSLPRLTLYQADKKLVIRGQSLKASFRMDEKNISASLVELKLEYPRLNLSGTLHIDQVAPQISVELKGREVDVPPIREVALAVAGEIPDVREIFDMVKGGNVPLITVNAQGSSIADLGKTENIFLKGSIVDGQIFLRGEDFGLKGIDLDLDNVKGDMTISRGILEAKNVESRLGNSRGREGILRLGLEGEDAPFHLETVMEVDLVELPPFIKGLIRDEAFDKELALIKDIQGSAVGKLVLGESTKSIMGKVDVAECNLLARYERIPYPVKIKDGWRFSYDGNTIGVQNLGGTVGKSSFTRINGTLSLENTPYLEIISGKSSIFLGEIYPWLSSLDGIKSAVKDLKSVQGTLAISTLNMKGPLSEPEKWRFRVSGEGKDLAVGSTLFPDPLTVTQVGFEATPDRLSLTDFETGILDASLRGSGVLHAYLEGVQKADFTLQGNVGPKAVQWASNMMGIPPEFRVRAPLSISRAQGAWKKDGSISFVADIGVRDGPKVSIDMLLNPEELTIKKLLIQDKESRASLAVTLREREMHLDFKGNLDKTTLDGLLAKNHILTGRIQGDLRTQIFLDHPMRSTAQGRLQGVGLGNPLELKVPLAIESISLNAKKNKLRVESALVTWGDSHLDLRGDMEFSEKEFLFDMNLSANGLEWEKIEGLLEAENGERSLEPKEGLRVPPLRGKLGVRLGYFRYGKFTWRPLRAEVSLGQETVKVTVTEANVCGISTPGVVEVAPQDLSLDFKPTCTGQEPGSVLACLLGTDPQMTGNLDLAGEIMGRAKQEDIIESLRGNFDFLARKGRIYRSNILLKILAVVNVTEIFRGKYPDLGREGFAYDSFTVKAHLQEGKLILKEAILDGSSMELVGQGEVDFMAEKMDLTVLVAPLKTVDFVVKKIPLVRDILSGNLVAIPVRVTGDLKNPTVRLLSGSAVGSELTGIMKRTFRLPLKVIEPFRPGKDEKEEGSPARSK